MEGFHFVSPHLTTWHADDPSIFALYSPQIQMFRKAKLGNEYADFYDENGNLKPDRLRLEIPDYDPTCRVVRMPEGSGGGQH